MAAGAHEAGKPARAAPIREPELPIVDAHHHLGYQHGGRYLVEDYARDIASGHDVVATVFVETGAMYRAAGPEHLRCVGEAEFAAGQAAIGDSGLFGEARICAAIVGAADLTLGDDVEPVLDALAAASGGRLRGIRTSAIWDADPSVNTGTRPFAPRGLLLHRKYRTGLARLVERGLVLDAFLYHPQLGDLADLADAAPDATIVSNHCGGLVRIGPYARPGVFDHWKALVTDLATRPNVVMKLGGLSGRRCGFSFETRETPATDAELAALWRPYVETCIELFGSDRCMFESNYPPDKASGAYATIWNAFKLITEGCSADEKLSLFAGVARRVYRID